MDGPSFSLSGAAAGEPAAEPFRTEAVDGLTSLAAYALGRFLAEQRLTEDGRRAVTEFAAYLDQLVGTEVASIGEGLRGTTVRLASGLPLLLSAAAARGEEPARPDRVVHLNSPGQARRPQPAVRVATPSPRPRG
jgi:hypothetical protein